MATNHTANYALNLWEPQDSFLRTEFNENSQKIDAAIKAEADARTALAQTVSRKAETSALNALTQTVAAKGNCTIVTGSYVGTGLLGPENPTVLDFAGITGRAPKFLFIHPHEDSYCFLAVEGMKSTTTLDEDTVMSSTKCPITWTATGLSWYNTKYPDYQLNKSNITYHYVALF